MDSNPASWRLEVTQIFYLTSAGRLLQRKIRSFTTEKFPLLSYPLMGSASKQNLENVAVCVPGQMKYALGY